MKHKIFIFFKSAKSDAFNDSMIVDIDGTKQGIIKRGEELIVEITDGNHLIEIYSNMGGKKNCYAKKELDINKPETYLTYAPPVVYTMNGSINQVANKEKYGKKQKNDKFYALLVLAIAVLAYIVVRLFL